MTIDELQAQAAAGNVESDDGSTSAAGVSSPAASTDYTLEEFLPLLIALQSVQQWLSTAPTFVPQTFQDQIQFVYDGTNYSMYFYANNQWNQVASSGGGGGAVVSVNTKTGVVVLTTADIADSTNKRYVTDADIVVLSDTSGTNTGDQTDATLLFSNITTNDVSITKHGFAPILPNDATKFLNGIGAWSAPSGSGGGMSSVTGTDNLTATTPISVTHTITHGLGKPPVLVSINIGQLFTPLPPGSGTNYLIQSCWMYLNGSGTAIGGMAATYGVTGGGGGSTTLDNVSFGPTSISATGTDSGGSGAASITVNNFTSTTFDIVYTASQSAGSSSFTFPTVTWAVLG